MKKKYIAGGIIAIFLIATCMGATGITINRVTNNVEDQRCIEPTDSSATGDLKVWLVALRDVIDVGGKEYQQIFVNIANFKLVGRVNYDKGDVAAKITISGIGIFNRYNEEQLIRMDDDGFWGPALPYPPPFFKLPNPKYFDLFFDKPGRGLYIIKVIVNPHGDMEEADYDNNEKARLVYISGN